MSFRKLAIGAMTIAALSGCVDNPKKTSFDEEKEVLELLENSKNPEEDMKILVDKSSNPEKLVYFYIEEKMRREAEKNTNEVSSVLDKELEVQESALITKEQVDLYDKLIQKHKKGKKEHEYTLIFQKNGFAYSIAPNEQFVYVRPLYKKVKGKTISTKAGGDDTSFFLISSNNEEVKVNSAGLNDDEIKKHFSVVLKKVQYNPAKLLKIKRPASAGLF